LGLPSDFFPSGFPTKTVHAPLLSLIIASCPAYVIIFFWLPDNICWGWQWSSSLCSFLHSPVTSFLLDVNILLNTLFSNTLSLRSSLSVSDQVSHPYKTTNKITVRYISLYIFG
jgi:hypothetical protein